MHECNEVDSYEEYPHICFVDYNISSEFVASAHTNGTMCSTFAEYCSVWFKWLCWRPVLLPVIWCDSNNRPTATINKHHRSGQIVLINPCHPGFILEILKIPLRFLQFLSTEMAQVLETSPHGWQGPIHSAWLLMSRRRNEPGHQQQRYCHSSTWIFRFQKVWCNSYRNPPIWLESNRRLSKLYFLWI